MHCHGKRLVSSGNPAVLDSAEVTASRSLAVIEKSISVCECERHRETVSNTCEMRSALIN